MRFIVVGGNDSSYDYPRGNTLCGFDGWGDALCSIGLEGFYLGAKRFTESDIRDIGGYANLAVIQICPQLLGKLDKTINQLSAFKTFIVVEPEGVSGQLERYSMEDREHFVSILRNADAVLSLSHQMTTELELWSDNVHVIGHPVDVKAIRKLRTKERFNPRTVWCGSYILRIYRDILMSVKVVHDLGLVPLVAASRSDDSEKVRRHFDALGLENVQVIQSRNQREFLTLVLSRCFTALQVCSRTTIGRTAAECACLGIPCIGTRNYLQECLFPELTLDNADTRTLELTMTRDVMLDSDNVARVVDYAGKYVKYHSHKKLAKRLLKIVEEAKK